MKLPKINFMFSKGETTEKKSKDKIYCYHCGIRIGTWRSKAIEYKEGHYCSSCHFKRAKERILKEKAEEKDDERND